MENCEEVMRASIQPLKTLETFIAPKTVIVNPQSTDSNAFCKLIFVGLKMTKLKNFG